MALRILHVGKYFPPYRGGMEVFLDDLLNEQRRQGIDAHALVHGDPLPDDPPWVVRVPVQFNLSYAPIALGFRSALNRAIDHIQPDVLHIHMPNNSALWALTLPGARKVPWVVHWHSDVVVSNIKWSVALAYMAYRPFEQALLERSQQIFATSPPYLQASAALKPWQDKCEVVPLGIDLRTVVPSVPEATDVRPPARLQWREDTQFKLLSIGRLTYYKGFETLIRAVSELPGVELLIAGDGELREELQALIDRQQPAGGPARVRLLGGVEEAEKHALLEACDLFCLASRERTEAFGIVLLEAMRHARACLVTDLPGSGMPWVVAQAQAGLHVPFEDIAAWRSSIARLQHNVDLRHRLAQSGARSLRRLFSIVPCTETITRYYRILTPGMRPVETRADLLVVISARNNEQDIARLIRRAHVLAKAEVVVVDNRSTDATCHIAEQCGAKVLRPLLEMTNWGSLQTGLRYAQTHGFESVVTIDAEGRYEVEELPALLSARGQADVVVAYFAQRNSFVRRLAWRWLRWLTDFELRDFVSGFRLYNRDALKVATSTEATMLDYQDIGILLLMRRQGLEIAELPLTLHSTKPDHSKIFRSWGNAVRYVATSSLLSIALTRRRLARNR
ncbi:glycosyl transferase family 1 [Paracidovorax avenae]|uniref:glycosyltransferase n=1 Tax=Paracidovorax avenae TaxID=80867 RepID=UPI000D16058C|nr:glycosyltransferase [Paracidovorax avenae]AVS87489.1 glycosyl transferase family 1 [Paracidovorax avenae]AVT12032.1 glycosyl transferase family 1 [Paracidovorax avenae]